MSDILIFIAIAVFLIVLLILILKVAGGSPEGKGPDAQRDFDKTYGITRSNDILEEIKPKYKTKRKGKS